MLWISTVENCFVDLEKMEEVCILDYRYTVSDYFEVIGRIGERSFRIDEFKTFDEAVERLNELHDILIDRARDLHKALTSK